MTSLTGMMGEFGVSVSVNLADTDNGERKRVYIAGPITGNPVYKEQFAEAEKLLRLVGYEVINPAKNTADSYKEYIDIGLKQLMQCDAIFMLKGYELSKGALLELHYARAVGMEILKESDEEDSSR